MRELLTAAIFVGIVHGAPLPTPKKPASIAGTWKLRWGVGSGECEFTPSGGWMCLWGGDAFRGTWRIEGDVLHVEEWQMPLAANKGTPLGSGMKWSVKLEAGGLSGPLSSGGRFALSRP